MGKNVKEHRAPPRYAPYPSPHARRGQDPIAVVTHAAMNRNVLKNGMSFKEMDAAVRAFDAAHPSLIQSPEERQRANAKKLAEREAERKRVERAWIARRKRNVDAGVTQFVTRMGGGGSALPPPQRLSREQILRHIHAVTPGEFERALAKCQIWLREHVRRPYALLLGEDKSDSNMNSTRWLARHVESALGPPAMTIVHDEGNSFTNNRAAIQALGVKSIVHLEDALYTGWQLDSVLNHLGIDTIPVFIAAAFATSHAKWYISSDRHFKRLHPDSRLYVASTMPDLPPIFEDVVHGHLTIMPQKVPNGVSFGVQYDAHDGMTQNVHEHVGTTLYHDHPNAIKLPWNYDPLRYSTGPRRNKQRAHARTAGIPI